MIWIFGNDKYGRALIEMAAAEAARMGWRATVVLSSRKLHRPTRLATTIAHLRWIARRLPWIARLRLRWRVNVRLVADVNSPSFVAGIGGGDIGLVCGFDQRFVPDAIDRYRDLVNVHPSVLPRYRGPVPSHWVIVNGETRSGYTAHRVTERLDDGPVLLQGSIEVPPGITEAALDVEIARAAAPQVRLLLRALVSRSPWDPVTLDAATVYRSGERYQGRP